MDRRDFLKLMSLAPIASFSNFSLASNKDPGYFLFVFLTGGADGLSMLVPYSDPLYKEYRKDTHYTEEEYLPISKEFAVNKLLKDSYCDWYKEGYANFYPLAGQLNNTRSHFNSQDTVSLGSLNYNIGTGLLTRLGNLEPNLNIISFTDNLPLILKGSNNKYSNLSVNFVKNRYDFNQSEVNVYKGDYTKVYENAVNNSRILKDFPKDVSNKMGDLGIAGKIMKENGYNFGYIELINWDTHANQSSTMDNQLKKLNNQLVNFKNVMGSDWNKTTIFVMSEFGRTVYENGTGTEHGWGNLISVFDGSFRKSNIIGEWNGLDDIHEDRELLVKNDYRDILFEVFQRKYGLKPSDKDIIFPK